MGVMSCSRSRCESIMCNTYVTTAHFRGYVCTECQEEFKEYLISMGKDPSDISAGEISRQLAIFMETNKDSHKHGGNCNVDEFFDAHTGN